jgi:hypothetical protein
VRVFERTRASFEVKLKSSLDDGDISWNGINVSIKIASCEVHFLFLSLSRLPLNLLSPLETSLFFLRFRCLSHSASLLYSCEEEGEDGMSPGTLSLSLSSLSRVFYCFLFLSRPIFDAIDEGCQQISEHLVWFV